MKLHFWNLKQWSVFGAVFVVASLAVWFGYYQWYLQQYANRPQSHQMSGVLKSVDDNKLIIFGEHLNDANPNIQDFSKRQDLTVIIDANTKLVKSVWYFPVTFTYLIENKIKLDPTKIQKEQQVGVIEDFKGLRGWAMTVKTKNNSINQTTLKAIEVEYAVFVYAK